MGKQYETLDDLRPFLEKQKMFFVATAPLADDGLLNLSPKGLDTFRILDATTVAYLDLVGSGVETVAHLRENGRIVILFCAFEGYPKIVRLHGRGEALEPGMEGFAELLDRFPVYAGTRAIIRVTCHRISDSCGFGVPRYDFVEDRPQLIASAERKGEQGLEAYKREKNRRSLDGLPGLRA